MKKKEISGSISLAITISFLTFFVSIISTVFFTPFLLKKVGDDYGVFGIVQSITQWLYLLATTLSASFVRFATKEIKESQDKEPRKTNTTFLLLLSISGLLSLIIGIIICLLFSFNVIHISSLTSEQYSLFNSILWLAIIQNTITIVLCFFQSYLLFKRKFVPVRLALLLYNLLYPLISIIVLIYYPSMFLVVIIMFVINDIINILLLVYSFIKIKIKFASLKSFNLKPLLLEIGGFSLFILINTIIETFNMSIDRLLLGFMCGASFVTIYQLGMSFRTYMNSMAFIVSSNYIPQINEHAVNGDIDSVNNLLIKLGTAQAAIFLLIVGGFASVGPEFVKLWVGDNKFDAFIVGLVLMAECSFPFCENIAQDYQRAMNKHHFRAYLYFSCMILNFIISITLISLLPDFNPIYSCLIGTCVANFIGCWVGINIYNSKVLKLKVFNLLLSYLIILISTLISVGFSYLIFNFIPQVSNFVAILIKGFSFVILYLVILLAILLIIHKIKPDKIKNILPDKFLNIFNKLFVRKKD